MSVAPVGDCTCTFEDPQIGKPSGPFFHVKANFHPGESETMFILCAVPVLHRVVVSLNPCPAE